VTGTALKRIVGLAIPLAMGGSVLAVRAAAAGSFPAGAPAESCTTATSASSTTTTSGGGLPIPTTLPITLPITLPGGGSTTTTTAATTTTTGGGTTTTGTGATTTTACATTTTASQAAPHIDTVATDHIAGHTITVNGTAGANMFVVVNGSDPKNGRRALGSATAASDGKWVLRLAHGVLYNTVVQASSGTQQSNKVTGSVHQVLNIRSKQLVRKRADGYHYKLTGTSASQIAGEALTVSVNGKIVGKGKMRSDGSFTVAFVTKTKGQKSTLKGTGKNGAGVVYTLPGKSTFKA